MDTIPAQAGSYALFLKLSAMQNLEIGRLGGDSFPPGLYVYLGSAAGPGGLKARLGRHLRGGGRVHWHVDYLRAAVPVIGYCYLSHQEIGSLTFSLECRWSQSLAALPESFVPMLGFGSSDCDAGCQAHLIAFPENEEFSPWHLRQVLANAMDVSPAAIVCDLI